jgi:Amt family ammonium transporter
LTENNLSELTTQLDATRTAVNLAWTLIAAFMVMFMQAGFALLEAGLTRAKNIAHTMGMNFLVYAIGIAGFWCVGFAIAMGGVGSLATLGGDTALTGEFTVNIAGKDFGLFGTKGFFLGAATLSPAVAALFIFQMMFMDTAATIPTGALAERWKFSAFVLFSFAMATVIYPVYANWVWGGGWLSALGRHYGWGHGHVDFAGSSVVHMTGGVAALVGAKLVGPRLGKFGPDGSPRAIPGHNVAMAVLGTFILAFGWFGFNAGSTLAATDSRIAVVALNTMLASATGALAACATVWLRFGKPDVSMMCNGMLAGMVAVTAPCAFVSTPVAALIGGIAGTLVVWATTFVEARLRLDDPVGAIAVHGVSGTWGVIALGVFANGSYGDGLNGVPGNVRGILYGDPGQLVASFVGIAANVTYVGLVSLLTFSVIGKLVGNRVSAADEVAGLDLPEMGMEGYAAEPGSAPAPSQAPAPLMPATAPALAIPTLRRSSR